MIIISILFLSLISSFIFLPQTIKLFNLSTTTPNDPISKILRSLLNFRYYILSKYPFTLKPKFIGKIDQIYVYPLKSVGYIAPNEWEIDEHGLKHDRQYMLGYWDEKASCYQAYTMRNVPRLTLVKIDYNLDENWFEFKYPSVAGLENEYKSFKLPCNITKKFLQENTVDEDQYKTDLWGIKFESINIGKALPSDFIKSMGLTRERTTLLLSAQGKFVKTAHPSELPQMRKVLFQDYYPIHLISKTTVDELNTRIKDANIIEREVTALQFRPNVVIGEGVLDLDFWFKVTINNHLWSVVQKTPRCSIGNVRLDKGDFDKTNIVSRTLRQYRRIDPGDKNGTFLGDYAIHHDSGYKIHIGDEFYLKQQKISTYLGLS